MVSIFVVLGSLPTLYLFLVSVFAPTFLLFLSHIVLAMLGGTDARCHGPLQLGNNMLCLVSIFLSWAVFLRLNHFLPYVCCSPSIIMPY